MIMQRTLFRIEGGDDVADVEDNATEEVGEVAANCFRYRQVGTVHSVDNSQAEGEFAGSATLLADEITLIEKSNDETEHTDNSLKSEEPADVRILRVEFQAA